MIRRLWQRFDRWRHDRHIRSYVHWVLQQCEEETGRDLTGAECMRIGDRLARGMKQYMVEQRRTVLEHQDVVRFTVMFLQQNEWRDDLEGAVVTITNVTVGQGGS